MNSRLEWWWCGFFLCVCDQIAEAMRLGKGVPACPPAPLARKRNDSLKTGCKSGFHPLRFSTQRKAIAFLWMDGGQVIRCLGCLLEIDNHFA